MSAYRTLEYARTCAHLGSARTLARSGVHVLVRPIEVPFAGADACAPYPLLQTDRWFDLAADLEDQGDLLSFVGVVDPLSAPLRGTLESVFPDHLVPFKQHQVAELAPHAPLAQVSPDHRRKIRSAARQVSAEVVASPVEHAAEWVRLYRTLQSRHGFTGAPDFGAEALAAQLALPGLLMVRAIKHGVTVSMSLWFIDGEQAHYHLGASDAGGYAAHASYATFALALETLAARGVRTVDLGGAAGGHDGDTGLARFKRGWATGTRTAWLGGRVLDAAGVERLGGARGAYFPAYRQEQRAA